MSVPTQRLDTDVSRFCHTENGGGGAGCNGQVSSVYECGMKQGGAYGGAECMVGRSVWDSNRTRTLCACG
jgi:hypothetical protein